MTKKVNGIIWTLIANGVILLILAVLIVWTDFMLRLIFGLIAIVIAYVFFYAAYKVHSAKKEVEKYLTDNFKKLSENQRHFLLQSLRVKKFKNDRPLR